MIQKLDKNEKKNLIAEKALEHIIENGINSLTMDEVAKKCELSKGSLYNYYKNKKSLIIASFSLLVEKVNRNYENIKEEFNFDTTTKANEISKNYSERLTKLSTKEIISLFEIFIFTMNDKELRKELTNIFINYYSKTINTLQFFFKSKTRALIVHSIFDGLAIYKTLGVDLDNSEIENEFKKILNQLIIS